MYHVVRGVFKNPKVGTCVKLRLPASHTEGVVADNVPGVHSEVPFICVYVALPNILNCRLFCLYVTLHIIAISSVSGALRS